jgi:ribosomal protein S1
MTSNTIIRAIKSGDFTNDELNSISDAIRFARAELARETKRQLSQGATVQFTSSGRVYYGTISSIKVKNAVVDTGGARYRVPMNMLTVATQVSE